MLCLLMGRAWAAGFDAPQTGSMDSGPLTADGAALFHNPALLARLTRPTVMFGLGAVAGRARVRRVRRGAYGFADQLDLVVPEAPGGIDPARTGEAEPVVATPVAPLGDVFAAVPVGPAAFGLGAYVPYAAVLSWPRDGAQRFALQDAQLIVSHLAAGGAVGLGKLSIGASAAWVVGLGELARVQDFAGLRYFEDLYEQPPIGQTTDLGRRAPSGVREQDVLARDFALRRGASSGLTFGLGAALDLGAVRVAASYAHGSNVTFRGRFSLDLDDPLFTNDLAPLGLRYPPVVRGDGSFSIATPRRYRLGIAGHLERTELRLATTLADWRRYDATRLELVSEGFEQPALGLGDTVPVEIARRWQPSLAVDVAVRRPSWLAGVGYDSPASPDDTVDAASIDGHRLSARGGTRLEIDETLSLWLGGRVQGIVPRRVTTSDHDLANGRYGLWLASVAVHLTYEAR